jgi:DNA-directed RNA polymerase subunit L
MKIKVLKRTSKELKIEVEGEGHTFCNVLQKALLEDDTIEMAGYDVPHPLVDSAIVYVRTKGKQKPEAALKEATKKILSRNKEFRKSFKKALKDWQRK